ncbi:OmpA family protein [Thalassobellus suaedae]|uniref:OmpA family protein n=1 Tax=Thalassobellus suaedae TaxID=3074124 RepID=A0ABY9XV17_9FLAO|nr:OmpA family protein [Flavobacteriaceae bacterium HL-DH14]
MVLDKDDNCINEAGTVANNGCPEVEVVLEPVVTEKIQKTLNDYAKTILFNSGKSSIKAESNAVLEDIVNILQEYPSAKFSIEGHTDSVGSNVLNQNLSEERASAVMNFLIEEGVASSRLMSKGYGESKPIANNTTSAGRAENRRVEINLIK